MDWLRGKGVFTEAVGPGSRRRRKVSSRGSDRQTRPVRKSPRMNKRPPFLVLTASAHCVQVRTNSLYFFQHRSPSPRPSCLSLPEMLSPLCPLLSWVSLTYRQPQDVTSSGKPVVPHASVPIAPCAFPVMMLKTFCSGSHDSSPLRSLTTGRII